MQAHLGSTIVSCVPNFITMSIKKEMRRKNFLTKLDI